MQITLPSGKTVEVQVTPRKETIVLGPKQTAWVEALESGKYKQGFNRLIRYDNYCCLGVACQIDSGILEWENCTNHPKPEKLGLFSPVGQFVNLKICDFYCLTSLNDELALNFQDIAYIIRQYPSHIFNVSV